MAYKVVEQRVTLKSRDFPDPLQKGRAGRRQVYIYVGGLRLYCLILTLRPSASLTIAHDYSI